jgi:hypothetical protein
VALGTVDTVPNDLIIGLTVCCALKAKEARAKKASRKLLIRLTFIDF